MIIHTMPQRSDEWWAVRCGKITASNFVTMANSKTKTTLDTLCYKTAAEKITGVPIESPYTNDAMEAGVALEDTARQVYELATLVHVQQVGFVEFSEHLGCSPDGLVGEDGGVEIKCPMPHTHLKYLTAGGNAWKAYRWQLHGFLWGTSRPWIDFVSYCPSFPPSQQLLIERVTPDKELFAKLEVGSVACVQRMDKILAEVQNGDL